MMFYYVEMQGSRGIDSHMPHAVDADVFMVSRRLTMFAINRASILPGSGMAMSVLNA